MAFIVENGTVVANANAYITTAFFTDYHNDRGRGAVSEFSTNEKQSAIIRATDYIEGRFSLKFKGHRTNPTGQSLSWPRRDVFDEDDYLLVHSNEIPKELMNATAEYALRAILCGEVAPDPMKPTQKQDFSSVASSTQTGDITRGPLRKNKVDVGRGAVVEEKEYFSAQDISQIDDRSGFTGGLVSANSLPEYPAADLMLRRLLDTGNRRTIRGS